ncbi:MAG: EF-hand domain-containing protein [Ruegeria sp.]
MKGLTIALPAFCLMAGMAMAQGGAHFIENWDADGDGSVTLDEAREKRMDVFHMFDADENDQLDAAEYDLFDETRAADIAANDMPKSFKGPANALKREFNDADGDGLVSKAEFRDGTEAWFVKLDHDGDGAVTLRDFQRMKEGG